MSAHRQEKSRARLLASIRDGILTMLLAVTVGVPAGLLLRQVFEAVFHGG